MTDPYRHNDRTLFVAKSKREQTSFKRTSGKPSRQEAGHTERHHGGAQGADPACARPGRISQRKPKVVPDAAHPGMWHVRWPDGRLSDMTNLTRAKDAVACFMETGERRQRGRRSPSEGRLCVKTGEMPARGAIVPAIGEHRVVASENGGARKQ